MTRPSTVVTRADKGTRTTVKMPAVTAAVLARASAERYVEPIDLRCYCRDERCLRLDAHDPHSTRELATSASRRRRTRLFGWSDDPFEVTAYEPRLSIAIDEAVVRAVGATPKNFATLYNDVRNDYGDVHERRLYRRVAALTSVGQIACVDLGANLRGYLRPGARILRDPEAMREHLEDLVYTRAAA